LGYYALAVVILDTIEAFASMWLLAAVMWWKTLVAGFVLKYFALSFVLLCADCILRLKADQHPDAVKRALAMLKNWLQAHRFSFDVVVSSFLFWTLSPIVAFDRIRAYCFPGFSIHNIIIYRQPGHPGRKPLADGLERRHADPGSVDIAMQRPGGSGTSSGIFEHFQSELEDSLQNATYGQDIVNFEQIFRELDVNRDGSISRDELLAGLYSKQSIKNALRLPEVPRHEDVQRFVDEADPTRSGAIDMEQFKRALASRGLVSGR
jgi:hypothetical protein